MRLTDLDPRFLTFDRGEDGYERYGAADGIEDAQGIMFLCPKCFAANGNMRRGVHQVVCWSRSRGVPDDATPGPGRWALYGTGYDDLTLAADPPNSMRSVKLARGCKWHGHITDGVITSCD